MWRAVASDRLRGVMTQSSAPPKSAHEIAGNRRLIRLATPSNLRDLGGYATANGRTIRWGQLFRSGALDRAEKDDRQILASLNVKAVCDLRGENERRQRPSPWSTMEVAQLCWDGPADKAVADVWQSGYPDTVLTMRAKMIGIYTQLPFWLGSRLRGLFAYLREGPLPLVFHCSIGKDRSGVAAALILTALGVPQETVIADYLLSNESLDLDRQTAEWMSHANADAKADADSAHSLVHLAPEVRRAMLGVDADYLLAAFAEIARRHGSIDSYLQSELGVGAAEREALAQVLLADGPMQ